MRAVDSYAEFCAAISAQSKEAKRRERLERAREDRKMRRLMATPEWQEQQEIRRAEFRLQSLLEPIEHLQSKLLAMTAPAKSTARAPKAQGNLEKSAACADRTAASGGESKEGVKAGE